MKTVTYLPCLLLIVSLISCDENNRSNEVELANIELLRGDIALCGQGFGELSFPYACDNDMRDTFNLAVALLHSFEYDEAEKAFVKVIEQDPKCAMAYWGVAMSNFHALWSPPDQKTLLKCQKLLSRADDLVMLPVERAFFDAIHSYYQDINTLTHRERTLRYESKMKQLHQEHPDNTEAAIFYALAMRAAADPSDQTYARQIAAGELLESLFVNQPNHPGIAHYIIHNYDYPQLAAKALSTARKYAEIAPASAHAQHMPSHIFTRLGLWQESITSNLKSTEAARCYAESVGIIGSWDEELHGRDYLTYAYLQIGDDSSAQAQVTDLQDIHAVYPANFKIAYAFTAIPARVALETRNWQQAATLAKPALEFPWEHHQWEMAIHHFARALGQIHLGDTAGARSELAQLKDLRSQLNDDYKKKQLAIQIQAVEAWLLLEQGQTSKALAMMEMAADVEDMTEKHPVTPGEVLPARELLGDMLMAVNKPALALEAYEDDLVRHPNRLNALYGAARAAEESSQPDRARSYYIKLVEIAGVHGRHRPALEKAVAYVSG